MGRLVALAWTEAHMADLDPIRGRETFVGRSLELAEICGGIDGAIEGRGNLFTLASEPGVERAASPRKRHLMQGPKGRACSGAVAGSMAAPHPYVPWCKSCAE
jgi:hypothetical protein